MVEEIKTDRDSKPSLGRSKELVRQVHENPQRAPVQKVIVQSDADYFYLTGRHTWDVGE